MKHIDSLAELKEFSTHPMQIMKNEKGFNGRINGVVALVDKKIRKDALDEGATWMVRITRKMDRYIIVSPLYRVKIPQENENELKALEEELSNMIKRETNKKVRQKQKFNYMSKNEILKSK